jgi:peptide deformylase
LAIKKIVLYPENEDALRRKSMPVDTVNRKVKRLIRDLKDTLGAHANGIGLAAPQINAHLRVVIVQLDSSNPSNRSGRVFTTLVNPVIQEAKQEMRDFDGCLSFPGLFGETIRPHYLRVSGLDEQGTPFDRVFQGFDAVVVHHEIDHLDGVLFIDRIENIDDLYRVEKDSKGRHIRVPLSDYLPKEEHLTTLDQKSYRTIENMRVL